MAHLGLHGRDDDVSALSIPFRFLDGDHNVNMLASDLYSSVKECRHKCGQMFFHLTDETMVEREEDDHCKQNHPKDAAGTSSSSKRDSLEKKAVESDHKQTDEESDELSGGKVDSYKKSDQSSSEDSKAEKLDSKKSGKADETESSEMARKSLGRRATEDNSTPDRKPGPASKRNVRVSRDIASPAPSSSSSSPSEDKSKSRVTPSESNLSYSRPTEMSSSNDDDDLAKVDEQGADQEAKPGETTGAPDALHKLPEIGESKRKENDIIETASCSESHATCNAEEISKETTVDSIESATKEKTFILSENTTYVQENVTKGASEKAVKEKGENDSRTTTNEASEGAKNSEEPPEESHERTVTSPVVVFERVSPDTVRFLEQATGEDTSEKETNNREDQTKKNMVSEEQDVLAENFKSEETLLDVSFDNVQVVKEEPSEDVDLTVDDSEEMDIDDNDDAASIDIQDDLAPFRELRVRHKLLTHRSCYYSCLEA